MTTVSDANTSSTETFTRYAMVAAAILFPLCTAIALFLAPFDVTKSGQDYVQGFADHIDDYGGIAYWIAGISLFAAIPALFAISKVARAGKPVLGLIGMILAFLLVIPVQGNTDDVIYAALKSNLDVKAVTALMKSLEEDVPSAPLTIIFLPGLVGVLLLGLAALLGKTAPMWASITLIVAPVLIPVPWFAGLGAAFAALTWLILTVGMGGVALALLPKLAAAPAPAPAQS
jgi:hypothetical protein